jgi:hypothetical protein
MPCKATLKAFAKFLTIRAQNSENDNYFIEKSKPTTEDHPPKKSSSKAKTKSSKKKSESSDHQSTKPEVKMKEPKPPVDDDIPNPFDKEDTTEPEAFPQNDDALLSYTGDEKEKRNLSYQGKKQNMMLKRIILSVLSQPTTMFTMKKN